MNLLVILNGINDTHIGVYIMDLMNTDSISGLILTIIIVSIFILKKVGLLSDVPNIFKNLFKNKPHSINTSDIVNHPLFNHMDFLIHSEIPTLEFHNKFKNVTFIAYLDNLFISYNEILKSLCNNTDILNMDSSELRKTLLTSITDAIYQYETKCRRDDIPELVINKMKAHNNDKLILTIDLIKSIFDNGLKFDNKLKMFLFLNIMQSLLGNLMIHSIQYINDIDINDLSGLTFRGNIIK